MIQTLPEKQCDECGGIFPPSSQIGKHRPAKRFCSNKCKSKFNNRRATRGAALYDLNMAWRRDRTKDSFSDLCHQIGIFLRQDVEDGRQSFNRHEIFPYVIPEADPKTFKGGKGGKV